MGSTLRRYQDTLRITGTGVIVLGIWSMLRTMLLFSFNPRYLQTVEEIAGTEIPKGYIYGIIAAFLGADLVLRLFVGLSARAQARGRKKSVLYLAAAGVMLVANLITFVDSILYYSTTYAGPDDLIAAAVIDVTSMFAFGCLVYAGICLRRYRSSAGEGEKTQ